MPRSRRRNRRVVMAGTAALLLLPLAAALAASNEATLEVVRDAALEGEHGVRVQFDGRLGPGQRAFLVDESPAEERVYRAAFWLDLDGLTMRNGDSLVLFEGLVGNAGAGPRQVPAFRLHLRKAPRNPAPRLVGELFGDDRRRTSTKGLPLPPTGRQRVQVEWRAASEPGAEDGFLRVSVLGAQSRRRVAAPLESATHRLLSVRLGVVGEVDAGSHGRLQIDGFESYRTLD